MKETESQRGTLAGTLFPEGIPRLWCPLLTHYREDGTIDIDRMIAHMHQISPDVEGFLIPGSTGDGWRLDDEQSLILVDCAVSMARRTGSHLLLGVLRPDARSMTALIDSMLRFLKKKTGIEADMDCLIAAHVSGFTVCPPSGRGDDQEAIYDELAAVADTALPLALYNIPFITKSELAPAAFQRLVARYYNIFLFKDSSGKDLIAHASVDHGGVFLFRGAEGNYADALKDNGGAYDGLLLSTANCFAGELAAIIDYVERGAFPAAAHLSDAITHVLTEVNRLTAPLHSGNLFAATMKAIDHFYAFGPGAVRKKGPLLYGGLRIPEGVIRTTGELLRQFDLMPARGYTA